MAGVHASHKVYFGGLEGGGRIIYCSVCCMYSEIKLANLRKRCNKRANVTRRDNLVKGLHLASGVAFTTVHRVHKTPVAGASLAKAELEEQEHSAATAPLEQPSTGCEAPARLVLGLAELEQLEAEYEHAAGNLRSLAPQDPFADDEFIGGWEP